MKVNIIRAAAALLTANALPVLSGPVFAKNNTVFNDVSPVIKREEDMDELLRLMCPNNGLNASNCGWST